MDAVKQKEINNSTYAAYSCSCKNFTYNFRELVKILFLARDNNIPFYGNFFKFCPWCGKKLIVDKNKSNLLYGEYYQSRQRKIEKIIDHSKYLEIEKILRRYTGSRKENILLDTYISQILAIVNPRSLLRYRKLVISHYFSLMSEKNLNDEIKKAIKRYDMIAKGCEEV